MQSHFNKHFQSTVVRRRSKNVIGFQHIIKGKVFEKSAKIYVNGC
jgi:hypothetical protein